MELSARQEDILQKTVFEYIEQAQPVSSGWLEARYDLPFSPATIRSELLALCEEGYLEQPHTSSGRIPTDKGYRFFVNTSGLHETGVHTCSALALAYYHQTLWKEGWEQVLQEPEFSNSELLRNFTMFLADIEKNIDRVQKVRSLEVYIGRENPFSSIGDFSMIVRDCDFDKGKSGFVAIVGPKRMPYHENIGYIRSIANIWKKRLKN